MCAFLLASEVGWLGDLREHVGLAQDEQVLALDLDLRAAVLGVEDLVALAHVERDALVGAVVPAAVTDGQDLALLGLLLRGVGEHETGRGGLLLLDRLDDQAVAERLELHVGHPPWVVDHKLLALPWFECQNAGYASTRRSSRTRWHSVPGSANRAHFARWKATSSVRSSVPASPSSSTGPMPRA